MSHTKGPWVFPNDGTLGTVLDSTGRCIAQVQQISENDRMTRHAERQANARLIAAAPELLEACREFVAAWGDHPNLEIFVEKMKAAIAKAEGRQP